MAKIGHISVLADALNNSPDSITPANDDIWVAYTNNTDSTAFRVTARSSNTTARAMPATAIR